MIEAWSLYQHIRYNDEVSQVVRLTDSTLSDKDTLARLVDLAKRMEQGVEVADRKYLFNTYEQCFVGSEAVEWLAQSGAADTPKIALALGNQMLRAGLFQHVTNEHLLENANVFYRSYTRSPPSRAARSA
mmetsp:Transcript_22182/g.48694  ORF Transcript_22182/g.48694 Transcript_22182/m.48694 type:complete len:130 (+) Transcript_22182:107-496(+)